MTLLLGIDTGGTYTDAVLLRDEREVVSKAKALTTRHDLAIGIGQAVGRVLEEGGVAPGDIAMVSLSTTLATNALVEGQGGRVGLILIGFDPRDLETHGLREALRGDPCAVLAGGHTHSGAEAAALDEAGLLRFLQETGNGVSAFAVASLFATRNPAHERRAAEIVDAITGRPVSASHQLSARLGGPKRALTALLNARLLGLTDALIGRAEAEMQARGISAPLMVVRGDGALMSVAQARTRPIETILSGPAASIVGARWLTGAENALVSDIGGTTTDVALLRGGRPAIDPGGAQVGGFRTMVEAVAMRTTGLGGDSEVHLQSDGLAGGVRLGPRRMVPVSLLAAEAPDAVHAALDAQLRNSTPSEHDGRFLRLVPGIGREGLGEREAALLERIGTSVVQQGAVLRNRIEHGALRRLVERGLVQIGGVTPSDASHVLNWSDAWDRSAAEKALRLFGRRRTGAGERVAADAEGMARMIVDQLVRQTGIFLLEAAIAEDDLEGDPVQLARHVLMQRGLSGGHAGIVRIDTGLGLPVAGLGASAATYYPAVGRMLGCEVILHADGDVANAIGAVVGRVTTRRSGTVTAPSEGRHRVHLAQGPEDFGEAEAALQRLESVLREEAETQVRAAGATEIEVKVMRDVKTAPAEAREIFVEATVTVEASGRPRVAVG